MKRTAYTLLPILAIALALGTGSAMAQNAGDNSTYAVDYFSYALTTGAPDGTLRVINDGDAAGADLCASVYVFDNSQELAECCSIRVTADGIISESVNRNLLSNPLTGVAPRAGVIKVISTALSGGTCTATAGAPTPGIRGWLTHPQKATSGYAITETFLKDSNLTASELSTLQTLCTYAGILGSGHGICTANVEGTAY
jgi:hypothetical protein